MSDEAIQPVLDRAPGDAREITAAHEGIGTTRLRTVAGVSGASFYVLDWEFPAGSSEGPHAHLSDRVGVENYHVTHGTVIVVVDGVRYELHQGDSIAIPRHLVREVRNDSEHPARVLLGVERLAG